MKETPSTREFTPTEHRGLFSISHLTKSSINMINIGFQRFAAAVAILSVITSFTRWPDVMFIVSVLYLPLWLLGEYTDYQARNKQQ
ncbi:hypothetical protein [Serratia ficaria]|uniref:hypothetical protein n=1 Tax=Serratia ficaria TaxID=61651 RepID=UPI0012B7B1A2|nr:hypothetical protein [Serratia ficaria]